MTRNEFMKTVRGSSKFLIDPNNCYEGAIKYYEEHKEDYSKYYLVSLKDHFIHWLNLVHLNAKGELKNYVEIWKKQDSEMYGVSSWTKYAEDNSRSDLISCFEISPEEFEELRQRHNVDFLTV